MSTRRGRRGNPSGPSEKSAPAETYSPILNAGFRALTTRVQQMHHAIADKTFDPLQKVPGLAAPARVVQSVHDAIADGTYAAVRAGASAVLGAAGVAETLAARSGRRVGSRERRVRSALSGVFGDRLAQGAHPFAIELNFYSDGEPLRIADDTAAAIQPRVCIFIHGLACDERSWFRQASDGVAAGSYGDRLAAERRVSPLYVRYNTGLPVAENAGLLVQRIESLLAAAPHIRQVALVGHSMGGLVARAACDLGRKADAAWLRRVSLLACLGTPHQGAPLERLGHLASLALQISSVTRPLADLANARSRGIKDLRYGAGMQGGQPWVVPVRLLAASLAPDDAGLASSMMSALLGDGLVMPSSAVDKGHPGDVQRESLKGIGHMGLLNDPRVYDILRRWWDETAG
jgi:pimeloyl-ACP methyl ester carboxylesterase